MRWTPARDTVGTLDRIRMNWMIYGWYHRMISSHIIRISFSSSNSMYVAIFLFFPSPKTNMDTQNDGLEKVGSFKIWPFFLVSMLDFYRFLGCNLRGSLWFVHLRPQCSEQLVELVRCLDAVNPFWRPRGQRFGPTKSDQRDCPFEEWGPVNCWNDRWKYPSSSGFFAIFQTLLIWMTHVNPM